MRTAKRIGWAGFSALFGWSGVQALGYPDVWVMSLGLMWLVVAGYGLAKVLEPRS